MIAKLSLLAAAMLALPVQEPDPLTCVRWWREVRYSGAGYDHWVHLESACTVRAVCNVVTDVNPDVMTVAVAPGEHVPVLTWRGSPAYDFAASVECRQARGAAGSTTRVIF